MNEILEIEDNKIDEKILGWKKIEHDGVLTFWSGTLVNEGQEKEVKEFFKMNKMDKIDILKKLQMILATRKDSFYRRDNDDKVHLEYLMCEIQNLINLIYNSILGEMNKFKNGDDEYKPLREGIEKALIPTDTNPIIHPLTKLSDLRKALKEMIE